MIAKCNMNIAQTITILRLLWLGQTSSNSENNSSEKLRNYLLVGWWWSQRLVDGQRVKVSICRGSPAPAAGATLGKNYPTPFLLGTLELAAA